jgi:hypothetical protein
MQKLVSTQPAGGKGSIEVIDMKKKELDKDFVPRNSSMAENVEEMHNLGKQMEHLRTGEELEEDGKHPDPIQYKEKEK